MAQNRDLSGNIFGDTNLINLLEALVIAREIEDESHRIYALSSLGAKLPRLLFR